MSQRRMLSTLLALSFAFQASCAVKAPDVPVCIELEPKRGQLPMTRGWCTRTMSAEEFYIDDNIGLKWPIDGGWKNKEWYELRSQMLLVPYSSWAEIKSFIIKICKQTGKCEQAEISSWDRTVERIDERLP